MNNYPITQSCKEILERNFKKLVSMFTSAISISAFCGIFAINAPWLLAYLRGEPQYMIEKLMPSMGTWILVLIILAIVLLLMYKLIRPFQKVHDQYVLYCNTESLLLGNDGIYGSTYNGAADIKYHEIAEVNTICIHDGVTRRIVQSDILRIQAKSGKEYRFYSFTNTAELVTAIRRQL